MHPFFRIFLAMAFLPVLSACVETQANLAPVIDRSIRPTATVTTVTGSAGTGVAPASVPAPSPAAPSPSGAGARSGAVPQAIASASPGSQVASGPASVAGAGGPVEPVIAPVAAAPTVETHALQPIAAPPLHVIPVDAPPAVVPVPAAGEGGAGGAGAPGAGAPAAAQDASMAGGAAAGSGPAGNASAGPDWIWPVQGSLAVRFDPAARDPVGRGIEIKVAEDAEVVAVADGVVRYVGHSKEYGQLIVVRHPDDWMSVYAFVRRALVAEGASVRRGQAIAVAGSTPGRKARLHFEVRRGKGSVVDPMTILPARP